MADVEIAPSAPLKVDEVDEEGHEEPSVRLQQVLAPASRDCLASRAVRACTAID